MKTYKSNTGKGRIMKFWKKRVWITQKIASDLFGIDRLSARIEEMRKAGIQIETVMRDVENRFGEKCRVGSYRLES